MNKGALQTASGSLIEQLVFGHRKAVLLACLLATILLGWQASLLRLNASFEKTIPTSHPYIANYLQNARELTGLGNAVVIAVENPNGSIYDAAYLESLRQINDEVFLIPGVYRQQLKSLWTPNTRWSGVTEEGLEGGPVVPEGYDGSARALQQLQLNVQRSGEIGQLVAQDGRSSVIHVPLLSRLASGEPLDYASLSGRLEVLRAKYAKQGVTLHITGFAKIVGDLIEGLRTVAVFFGLSLLVTAAFVYGYTRCVRSTTVVLLSSLLAVVWQLGILRLMGLDLDPYSMLVPFLVFAIGISHGAQKMNGIMQDIGRGQDQLVAARLTFRRLFLTGLTALLADAMGFAVLFLIDIGVIRELAMSASIGVGVLILTNLILLPILLSFIGVSERAARRSLEREQADGNPQGLWTMLCRLTQPKAAGPVLAIALVLGAAGFVASWQLKVGDLDPGAPEFHPGSRYNRDVAFLNANYAASSDVFAVMVKTPEGACSSYDTLMRVDVLEGQLRELDGVESTSTLSGLNRRVLVGLNEGNPKWYELIQNQQMINTVTAAAQRGLYNDACSLLTVYVYLKDHKADTLKRVVDHVEAFAAANDSADVRFQLAAGTAGIEAATNMSVAAAWNRMLVLVYVGVMVLCFITFRSWRAVLVAMLPLMLTSLLAEALMVALGIGVKVATLPVIALGVGIGVDYSLYILSVTLARLREGMSLAQAYHSALLFTGRVVLLTGATLAVGVGLWGFSDLKFQADMGILLAFMFLGNMVGALTLVPALACFLIRPAAASPAAIDRQTNPALAHP